jgi:hypothetical protein
LLLNRWQRIPIKMGSARLSDLSPELICLILDEVTNVRDFFSLIGVSRKIYALYLAWKTTLTSNLLKRVLAAEVLRDAQIALRSSQFPFPVSKHIEQPGISEQPRIFLEFINSVDKLALADQAIPLTLSIPLCRIHSSIEYLIEDFCIYCSSALNQGPIRNAQATAAKPTDLKTCGWAPLSESELVRLQRAFYRHNTCQNMMRATASFGNQRGCADEQLAEFLSTLSPWGAEEIACVRNYILKRLDFVVEKLEGDFIQSVFNACRNIMQNRTLAKQASRSAQESLICLSKILHPEFADEDHCLGMSQSLFEEGRPEKFFSIESKKFHNSQMGSLATLGAPFLQTFFESNSKTQLELIERYGGTWCYELGACLDDVRYRPHVFHVKEEDRLQTLEGNSPSHPNNAWLWAKPCNGRVKSFRFSDRHLRALGYVFWDSDRLQKEANCMDGMTPKKFWTSPSHGDLPKRRKTQSAEQRLSDLGLVLSLHE